ncbi:hypothetical protein SAMN04488003_10249 [Loktanella fryxellensis]|uniref:Uncharacterized protein n=1 Tax=Loktanella fryxellensis TaxID=245187 RepID=A0A1H7ZN35_9RHOB|nr:hypothetical protein SAMN04488003_10249 [Loktanella fryxellensis]
MVPWSVLSVRQPFLDGASAGCPVETGRIGQRIGCSVPHRSASAVDWTNPALRQTAIQAACFRPSTSIERSMTLPRRGRCTWDRLFMRKAWRTMESGMVERRSPAGSPPLARVCAKGCRLRLLIHPKGSSVPPLPRALASPHYVGRPDQAVHHASVGHRPSATIRCRMARYLTGCTVPGVGPWPVPSTDAAQGCLRPAPSAPRLPTGRASLRHRLASVSCRPHLSDGPLGTLASSHDEFRMQRPARLDALEDVDHVPWCHAQGI